MSDFPHGGHYYCNALRTRFLPSHFPGRYNQTRNVPGDLLCPVRLKTVTRPAGHLGAHAVHVWHWSAAMNLCLLRQILRPS
jgi:hypothetical protein